MFPIQDFIRLSTLSLLLMSPLLNAQEPAPTRYESMVEALLRDSIAGKPPTGWGKSLPTQNFCKRNS